MCWKGGGIDELLPRLVIQLFMVGIGREELMNG